MRRERECCEAFAQEKEGAKEWRRFGEKTVISHWEGTLGVRVRLECVVLRTRYYR